MTGVLCVGIATLDHVYQVDAMPVHAEKHRARNLLIVGGGLAANASVAVARLGGESALAARLGDDITATAILEGLLEEGVDPTLCRRFDGRRSPVSTILVDAKGERMVISYSDPAMPADPSWLPDRLPVGIDAVLGDTRWDDGSAALFRLARAAGKPAVLDGDRKPAHSDVLRLATHVAFSMQGICEITGVTDPRSALLAYAGTQVLASDTWLAVTLGGEGVAYLDGGELRHVPGFDVRVVDTLGAGDVWHGAFALALAEGRQPPDAIRFASATAALKCMRFGGRAGAPTRAEVEQFLRERP
jgi:sulfofructose kinase